MKKRICSLIAALALLLSVGVPGLAVESMDDPVARESQASSQYNTLLASFLVENEIVYPDYFAGAYINDVHDLVIMVTADATPEDIENIKLITGKENLDFDFDLDYSKNELTALHDIIVDYYQDNYGTSEFCDNLNFVAIQDSANGIEVGLQELDHVDVNDYLTEVFGTMRTYNVQTLPITFVEAPVTYTAETANPSDEEAEADAPMAVSSSTNIHTAQRIAIVHADKLNCSNMRVGFPVKLKNNTQSGRAFITAAHELGASGIKSLACWLGDQTARIGTTINSKLGGAVDASLVILSDGYTCSNQLYDGIDTYKILGYATGLQNETVYAEGRTLAKGTIESTSITRTFKGVYIKDLYQIAWEGYLSPPLDEGDSGTPLYRRSGTSSNFQVVILGILSFGDKQKDVDLTDPNYPVYYDQFCKVTNILNDSNLGIQFDFGG